MGQGKSKGGNVTLVRSSSRRSSNSDSTENINDTSSTTPVCTPQRATSKILPFDPRSPAEEFTRTPIAVTTTNTEASTPSVTASGVTLLTLDPRSPSQQGQVNRTPIIVESTINDSSRTRQLQDAGCSPVTVSKSNGLSNICTTTQAGDDEDTDPRSPTSTVPRTPLEDKNFDVTGDGDESGEQAEPVVGKRLFTEAEESEDTDESSSADSHRALQNISNAGAKSKANNTAAVTSSTRTPLGLLQAKQCRIVEEEFAKNQRNLLAQLHQSDENTAPVPSSTQFVEQI